MIQVTTVQATPDYQLVLRFNNGELRRFEMRSYLRYPVFRRLENPAFFALARVDYGTVSWPGEIDIAPETLYQYSVPMDAAAQVSRVGGGDEETLEKGVVEKGAGKGGRIP